MSLTIKYPAAVRIIESIAAASSSSAPVSFTAAGGEAAVLPVFSAVGADISHVSSLSPEGGNPVPAFMSYNRNEVEFAKLLADAQSDNPLDPNSASIVANILTRRWAVLITDTNSNTLSMVLTSGPAHPGVPPVPLPARINYNRPVAHSANAALPATGATIAELVISGAATPDAFAVAAGKIPGDLIPLTDGTANIGSAERKLAEVHTRDIHAATAVVDSITGNPTIAAGAVAASDDITLGGNATIILPASDGGNAVIGGNGATAHKFLSNPDTKQAAPERVVATQKMVLDEVAAIPSQLAAYVDISEGVAVVPPVAGSAATSGYIAKANSNNTIFFAAIPATARENAGEAAPVGYRLLRGCDEWICMAEGAEETRWRQIRGAVQIYTPPTAAGVGSGNYDLDAGFAFETFCQIEVRIGGINASNAGGNPSVISLLSFIARDTVSINADGGNASMTLSYTGSNRFNVVSENNINLAKIVGIY